MVQLSEGRAGLAQLKDIPASELGQRQAMELERARLDLAQGLNQEGKAVRKGKKPNSLTARADHLQLPLPVNQERLGAEAA